MINIFFLIRTSCNHLPVMCRYDHCPGACCHNVMYVSWCHNCHVCVSHCHNCNMTTYQLSHQVGPTHTAAISWQLNLIQTWLRWETRIWIIFPSKLRICTHIVDVKCWEGGSWISDKVDKSGTTSSSEPPSHHATWVAIITHQPSSQPPAATTGCRYSIWHYGL